MTAGPLFQIKDFYGKTIAYQGIEFEGSPRHVFWGRYVEPFLEDVVDKIVNEALRLAEQKNQDTATVLADVSGLLKSLSIKHMLAWRTLISDFEATALPKALHFEAQSWSRRRWTPSLIDVSRQN
jgi:hypothetical protein